MQEPDLAADRTVHVGSVHRKLVLFLAVLVLTAGAAWGAGRSMATLLPPPVAHGHLSTLETR